MVWFSYCGKERELRSSPGVNAGAGKDEPCERNQGGVAFTLVLPGQAIHWLSLISKPEAAITGSASISGRATAFGVPLYTKL